MAEAVLEVDKVLMAIEELRRWEHRALELARFGRKQRNPVEYARARQQVTYYSGLLQDMKRRSNPDSPSRLIRRLE
jgi:hypothetical protein